MSGADVVFLTANGVTAESSLLWDVVRVFAALLLLLPFVYVCTKFYASRVRGTSTHTIQVIDRVVLGNQRSLVLVRIGKRIFFLSVADKQVVKLGEWEDDGHLPVAEMAEDVPNFAAILRRALQKREQGADQDEK